MLRAHRSTFKPQSGSCLTRGDTGLISPQSQGLGEFNDAGFDTDDNFYEFQDASFTEFFPLPSDAKIARIYVSAAGSESICYAVPNGCDLGPVFCPETSVCCPPCTQGLCCIKETGECGIRCQEDCVADGGCFDPNIDPGEDPAVIEELCEFCGRSACCSSKTGDEKTCTVGPLCFAPDGDCTPSDCTQDLDCQDFSYNCADPEGTCEDGTSSCGCVKVQGSEGAFGTLDECLEQCKGRWQCCPEQGCNYVRPDEQPIICGGSKFFCAERECRECCALGFVDSGTTAARNIYNPYEGLVIPGRVKPGYNLTADQIALFEAGPKPVGLAPAVSYVNITPQVAAAYNARRESALAANIQPIATKDASTTIGSYRGLYLNSPEANFYDTIRKNESGTEAFGEGECDICLNGVPAGLGNENCGAPEPAMFILEYDLGELCALTNVRIAVIRKLGPTPPDTWLGGKDEIVQVLLQYERSGGKWTTLLVDVASKGYVLYDGSDGEPDYNCTTCEFTFDCASLGTSIVDGLYPSFEVPVLDGYDIPSTQPAFNVASGKTQNIRTSTHTLINESTELDVTITTGILATGQAIQIYTDTDDASRVDIIKAGPASAVSLEKFPDIITNRLKWDVDRISSEYPGNTYIAGNSGGALVHPYGVSGNGLCAQTGQQILPGEPLFGVIAGSTATYTDTGSGGGGEDVLLFRVFRYTYTVNVTQVWEQGCQGGLAGCGTNNSGTASGDNVDFGLGTDSTSTYVIQSFHIIDEDNQNVASNSGTIADVGEPASIALQFNILTLGDSGGRSSFLNLFGLSDGASDEVTVTTYEYPDPLNPLWPGREASVTISGIWTATPPSYAPSISGQEHQWLFFNGTVTSKTVYSNDNLWSTLGGGLPEVNNYKGAYITSASATSP